MFRFRDSHAMRASVVPSVLMTLVWGITPFQAQTTTKPTTVYEDPSADTAQMEYPTILQPSNQLRIQSAVDAAPDELPAGGVRSTVVFTIRNANQSYGGDNRPSSVKLIPGDKLRINLGSCSSSISFVYPVDSNLGGSFS